MARETKVIIDLDAIKENYLYACKQDKSSKTIAVIKANAYGHGAVNVAQHIEDIVPAFAVAIFEEAVELREAGIQKPILILQGINQPHEVDYCIHQQCWPMIANYEQAELLLRSEIKNHQMLWLKYDTRMHRLGLNKTQILKFLNELKLHQLEKSLVLCTHLACASDLNSLMTINQIDELLKLKSDINGIDPLISSIELSISNSAELLAKHGAWSNWNRAGIMLYGLNPFESEVSSVLSLKPAMTFVSNVIAIRDLDAGESVGYGQIWTAQKKSKIATIAVGYADGFPRHAKNGTPVFINGNQAKLAGRVSMDMITIDITDIDSVNIGTEVELWGLNLSADVIANCCETISYELVTGISRRVPIVYSDCVTSSTKYRMD